MYSQTISVTTNTNAMTSNMDRELVILAEQVAFVQLVGAVVMFPGDAVVVVPPVLASKPLHFH